MKKYIFVFVFCLFGSLSLGADQGDISFGANVGQVGLTHMSKYGTNGFGFGGYFSYAPSDLFDLDFNFIYSPHSNGGNNAKALYGTVALKFGLTFDQLLPYLTATPHPQPPFPALSYWHEVLLSYELNKLCWQIFSKPTDLPWPHLLLPQLPHFFP